MIILMGLAGSGKSTQGNILANERGAVWLSAGQVLRDTPNEEVHEIQRRGELVPDTITIPLMAEAMARVLAEGKDIVLDGYPRTIEQAEWVAENAADRILVVVRIEVPKDELIRRMELRGRADDMSREAIEERFRIVEQNIYTVCEILEAKNVKIVRIDGVGTPEEVTERIQMAVNTAEELKEIAAESASEVENE